MYAYRKLITIALAVLAMLVTPTLGQWGARKDPVCRTVGTNVRECCELYYSEDRDFSSEVAYGGKRER